MSDLLAALLRTDLRYFVRKVFITILPGTTYLPNWHIDAIVYQLMRLDAGEHQRLLINQPPRSLKSICVSIAYVAWSLGHDPGRRIIVVSYSNDFAAELHRQFRMVIDAPWYRALFPRMRPAKDTGTELVTTAGGSRYATSVGGTLTGRGADLIVIDDPLKAEDAMSEPARRRVIDWYGGSLVSRLNDKDKGPIVVVMQRLHEDDLAGHLLQLDGWHHLDLPAIAVEDCEIPIGRNKRFSRRTGDVLHAKREDQAVLDRIKAEIGSLMFSAQYQQRPIPLEGNLIKRDWIRHFKGSVPPKDGDYFVISWDTAMKATELADYSVGTVWHVQNRGRKAHLVDLVRGRFEYPELIEAASELWRKWKVDWASAYLVIEDKGSGSSLIQSLRNERIYAHQHHGKIEGDKVMRLSAQAAHFHAGVVHFPEDAPWLDELITELLGFPGVRHDDQVDSISQALAFISWSESHRSSWQPLPF